jgi:hypothetical protein
MFLVFYVNDLLLYLPKIRRLYLIEQDLLTNCSTAQRMNNKIRSARELSEEIDGIEANPYHQDLYDQANHLHYTLISSTVYPLHSRIP